MRTASTLVAIAFASFLVSACGGGGGGGDGGAGGGTQPPTSFTVGTSATGTGSGTLSPISRSVTQGSATSFTISAGSDSRITGVSGCGGSLNGSTYTTGPINGNCTVSASFNLNTYMVTATAGTGGSISPDSLNVTHGNTTTFSVTPDSGREIESVSGCSGTLSGNTYTTGPITATCSVSASFRDSGNVQPPTTTFTISTATNGNGAGTITPAFATVEAGQTFNFLISSWEGSTISGVSGCGGVLNGNTYTTGAITADCFVTATLHLNEYTVRATAGEGGSISPASVSLEHGAIGEFTLNSADGYRIDSVTGCGGTLDDVVYTTAPVFAPCLIVATFSAQGGSGLRGPLNDTGIDWCADSSANYLGCPVVGFSRQDGDEGRDARAVDGSLPKQGGGDSGFDLTKLDSGGRPLNAQGNEWSPGGNETDGTQWSCVRDNLTGLAWDATPGSEFYFWYDPAPATNGGNPGRRHDPAVFPGLCSVVNECDTYTLVNYFNTIEYCGVNNWRVPTANELLNLLTYREREVILDKHYFPNSPSYSPDQGGGTGYWTSSTYAGADGSGAWSVNVRTGALQITSKLNAMFVILVSGGEGP